MVLLESRLKRMEGWQQCQPSYFPPLQQAFSFVASVTSMTKPKKPVYPPAPQKYVVFRHTPNGMEYIHPTQEATTIVEAYWFTLIEAEAVARMLNERWVRFTPGPRRFYWWGVAEV